MKPMVRPARPASWNRRNSLMNRQRTVWNRPKPKRSNQVPNGTGPTRTVAITIGHYVFFLTTKVYKIMGFLFLVGYDYSS